MTVPIAPNVNHDHTGTWKGLLQPGQHASLLGFLFPLDLRTRGRVWFYKGGVAGPDAPKIQALPKLG